MKKELFDELIESHLQIRQVLLEGVFDQGIFKAVFIAGGPGSGKSTISNELFGVSKDLPTSYTGMKYINQDNQFERILKKHNISTDFKNMDPEEFKKVTDPNNPKSLRNIASDLSNKQLKQYISSKIGVVIDGTGHKYDKIRQMHDSLTKLGYDCYMIFININLTAALKRNNQRSRKIPDEIVTDYWKAVQRNLGRFQGLFTGAESNNLLIIDNSKEGISIPQEVTKTVRRFSTEPIKNHIGKEWIENKLAARYRSK